MTFESLPAPSDPPRSHSTHTHTSHLHAHVSARQPAAPAITPAPSADDLCNLHIHIAARGAPYTSMFLRRAAFPHILFKLSPTPLRQIQIRVVKRYRQFQSVGIPAIQRCHQQTSIAMEGKDGKPTAASRSSHRRLHSRRRGHDRPVMFRLQWRPLRAASSFLNFGAVRPKHVSFGNAGDSPSDPAGHPCSTTLAPGSTCSISSSPAPSAPASSQVARLRRRRRKTLLRPHL